MLKIHTDYRDAFHHILQFVDEEISSGKVPTVSFDVFDTLLQRRVSPDLVLAGAARWLDQHIESRGLQQKQQALSSFTKAYRTSCESNTRQGLDQEANTSELYALWIDEVLEDHANQRLRDQLSKAIEAYFEQIEIRTTYAAPHVLELLEDLKQRQCRIIYISDMYIGDRCVSRILAACGLLHFFDAGYVSGDHGLLKRTGNLFKKVARLECAELGRILHIGDNKHADGEMAKKSGLNAIVIEDKGFLQRRSRMDLAFSAVKKHRDWGGYLAALSAQAMAGEIGTREHAVTLRLLGPIFSYFIHKVAERCRDHGIEKIYFCAREGYVLKELFNRLAPLVFNDGPKPTADYLPISRLSALTASARHFGLRELSATAANGPPTIVNLLSFLQLSADELSKISASHGIEDVRSPLPPFFRDWPPFQRLLEDPRISKAIQAKHSASNALLGRYLDGLGFFNHSRVALIDVGWSGRIQEFLHEAIKHRSDAPQIFGFYMGTRLPAHWRKTSRNWIEPVLADECQLDWYAQACLLFPQLFEAVVRSPHGTVLGYEQAEDGTVEPVFKSDSLESRIFEAEDDPFLCHIQMALFEYADHYATTAALAGIRADDTRSYALEALNRLVRFPSKDEAEIFLQLRNVSDLGSSEMISLGNKKSGHWLTNYKTARREIGKSFWKYGTASRFGRIIPQIYFLLFSEVKRIPRRNRPLNSGIVSHQYENVEVKTRCKVDPKSMTGEQEALSRLEDQIGTRIRMLSNSYASPFDYVDLEASTQPLGYKEVKWARLALSLVKLRLMRLHRHAVQAETLPLVLWRRFASR
ncbi:HAD family hydrolase [Roseibium polysiphoniae]|uniref:HAD hydrolase-like protein n=1 Tax=Roseibium polysiphoniae TaxID=2571221 RepID=A0ABR9CAR5_9HYPH|nr:HAD family hydrolase [Roseibium polysiphoniae]MBD8876649.1 HAD hydrolase-like protein [Roseibium polysiphoniae]